VAPAAEVAHEPFAIEVHDLADQGGTMAVHAVVAAGAERAHAVPEEGDLYEGVAVPGEREHGVCSVRHEESVPSIDPVP